MGTRNKMLKSIFTRDIRDKKPVMEQRTKANGNKSNVKRKLLALLSDDEQELQIVKR